MPKYIGVKGPLDGVVIFPLSRLVGRHGRPRRLRRAWAGRFEHKQLQVLLLLAVFARGVPPGHYWPNNVLGGLPEPNHKVLCACFAMD